MRISVKCDALRRLTDEWRAILEAVPDLPERLKELGVDDVEASISLSGDPEDDRFKFLSVREWYAPWREAGIGLHLHPYTSGQANPATYSPGANDVPVTSLAGAAELLHELTRGAEYVPKLVYHAAEAKEEDFGTDPRAERYVFLERSRRFFADAWARIEREEWRIQLVTETQIPPDPARALVRIGDRPEEIAAIVGDRTASVCLDTGHYLVSRALLGSGPEPELLRHVGHMHLHDVDGIRDHRPLTAESERVANYVGLSAERGQLTSATLEYKLNRALPDPESLDAQAMLRHVQEAGNWVRSWAAAGNPEQRAV